MIHSSFSCSLGDVGETGSVGPQGPPGPPGEKGKGLSGVKYVRWGRTNCSGNVTTVYSGKVGYLFNNIFSFNKLRQSVCHMHRRGHVNNNLLSFI